MTKTIALTRGLVTLVDDEDFEWLSTMKWHAATHGSRGQWSAGAGHRTIRMHRLIMSAPVGMQVDHINGDPLDNRRCNLRLCTRRQNQGNRRSVSNCLGVKGVTLLRGAFVAAIRVHGKLKYLGAYKTKEDAARAYDRAAVQEFGTFAATNQDLKLVK
jgi:hypothetical protein